MISTGIRAAIEKALQNLDISGVSFVVEHPTDLSRGDYATNVAMAASKTLGKNPREVAEMIVAEINNQNVPEIESIEIAGPGFINFKLVPEFFTQSMKEIITAEDSFGNLEIHAGKNILIEHSSPNLFKPFHIGHMMNNAIGESLVRLMRASGARVTTMSFPSDISLGVAKAVYALYYDSLTISRMSEESGFDNAIIAGDAYVVGTRLYDDSDDVKTKVKEIADVLYDYTSNYLGTSKDYPKDELEKYLWTDLYLKFSNASRTYLFSFLKDKLETEIDHFIFESESGIQGKRIVEDYTPSVFVKSEGAIVYIPDELRKDINTSVFINSQSNPTYEAKDLGLIDLKFERFSPDLSIFVTDHEQIPHFNIVLAAYADIEKEKKNHGDVIYGAVEKSEHVPHGRMLFKGQKMSSRLGGVPPAAEMIEDVALEVKTKMLHRDSNYANIDYVCERIAIGAIKFAILRAKPGMNINFDPETSLSFEGDSGPYLQYTHARIQTLLDKGLEQNIAAEIKDGNEISDIEKILYRFPEVVESAITEYAPNYIVTYLLEVARSFNSFYGANKIIDTENPEMSSHRLAIARATQIVIKNGLQLLAIEAPDRM